MQSWKEGQIPVYTDGLQNECRSMLVQIPCYHKLCLAIIAAYAPSSKANRQTHLNNLVHLLSSVKPRYTVIIAGDFNSEVGTRDEEFSEVLGPQQPQQPRHPTPPFLSSPGFSSSQHMDPTTEQNQLGTSSVRHSTPLGLLFGVNRLMHYSCIPSMAALSARERLGNPVPTSKASVNIDELKLPGDNSGQVLPADQVCNGVTGFALCNSIFLQPRLKVLGGRYMLLIIPGPIGNDLRSLITTGSATLVPHSLEILNTFTTTLTFRGAPCLGFTNSAFSVHWMFI